MCLGLWESGGGGSMNFQFKVGPLFPNSASLLSDHVFMWLISFATAPYGHQITPGQPRWCGAGCRTLPQVLLVNTIAEPELGR